MFFNPTIPLIEQRLSYLKTITTMCEKKLTALLDVEMGNKNITEVERLLQIKNNIQSLLDHLTDSLMTDFDKRFVKTGALISEYFTKYDYEDPLVDLNIGKA